MIELNKIYNGDCLIQMKYIDDKSIDMILCDLPYGATACKWDVVIPLEPLWEQYNRIIKDNGAIVLFGSEPFSSKLRMSNIKQYKYDWVWDKVGGSNFLNIKNRPLRTHEDIIVFSQSANFTFNPIRVKRTDKSLQRDPAGTMPKRKIYSCKVEHYNINKREYLTISEDGLKHPIDIIKFSIYEKGRYEVKHPTKKPLALCEYLIRTYTNEGELVLDNCIGSGTTAIACINTNRNFIGIEKEEKYCEIANQRIKKYTDQYKMEL